MYSVFEGFWLGFELRSGQKCPEKKNISLFICFPIEGKHKRGGTYFSNNKVQSKFL